MKTSELLMKAKKAIEQYGWIQGRYGNTECGFCMLGALDVVESSYLNKHRLLSALVRANGFGTIVSYGPIGEFNDNPSRTKKEIYQAFDNAIELAEKEEANATA